MNKNIEELPQKQETLEDLVKTLNANDSWDLYCIGIKLREKSIWLEELTKKTNECWELQEELKQLKKQKDELQKEMDYVDDYNRHLLKQKNDVVEYIKNYIELEDAPINERIKIEFKELLRMLGEIDEENIN